MFLRGGRKILPLDNYSLNIFFFLCCLLGKATHIINTGCKGSPGCGGSENAAICLCSILQTLPHFQGSLNCSFHVRKGRLRSWNTFAKVISKRAFLPIQWRHQVQTANNYWWTCFKEGREEQHLVKESESSPPQWLECPIPGDIQGQAGCGSEQPGLVIGKAAHNRGVETWWSLWSFSTQAMLWFIIHWVVGSFRLGKTSKTIKYIANI